MARSFSRGIGDSDKILNAQAVCFFHLAQGAELGMLVAGRRGSPTRLDFDDEVVKKFVDNENFSDTYDEINNEDLEETDQPHDLENEKKLTQGKSNEVVKEETGQGIFIAHGKNKKPLEQLKKILDQFKIQYRVAIDEPNLGRPIGSKIREIMRSCNCAILIFTADEEFKDKDGNAIWRPSENVVYELGASGYLYDNRIVIMKEESVDFPSNFRDIGYISFANDQLEAKAMEILAELIGFGIVKVST